MKRLLLLLLLLLPASADASPRILSGSLVPEEHFRSAAALVLKKTPMSYRGQFCGGVVVHPRWVLTAAHCSPGKMWRRTDVVLGRKNLARPGGQRLAVHHVVRHPRYENKGTPSYDFALLRLSGKARVPALRDWREGPVPAGRDLFVAGWGETEWRTYPHEMREVRVRSFGASRCQERYGGGRSVFCAGRARGQYDSCYGDSGGPIVSRSGGREQLWGLVSFGRGCGLARWPGAYARVGAVASWIRETIQRDFSRGKARPGRDLFPSQEPQDLGPLRFVEIEKKDWNVVMEEAEHLFFVRVEQSRTWPLRSARVHIDSGLFCVWQECGFDSLPLEKTPRGWFAYFYTSNPCPEVRLRVQLRRNKQFLYTESVCQSSV